MPKCCNNKYNILRYVLTLKEVCKDAVCNIFTNTREILSLPCWWKSITRHAAGIACQPLMQDSRFQERR